METAPPQQMTLSVLVRAAWDSVAATRIRFYFFVLLFVLAYSVDLAAPWVMGYVLGIFASQGFSETSFYAARDGVFLYLLVRLVSLGAHHVARYHQLRTAYAARMYTLNRLFGAIMDYPLSWHVRHHSGDSLSKLYRSASAIESFIGTYLWQIIEGFVKVVFAGIAIMALDFWVAVNVLATSLVTILLMVFFNSQLARRIRENNAFYDRFNRLCVDQFFNVVTVKTLGLEARAKSQMMAQWQVGAGIVRRISALGELKWGSIGIGYTVLIGSSLIIYFYNHTFPVKPFEIAAVYVLINYLDRIFQAIGSFTGYYSGIIESMTAYEDATKILAGHATVRDRIHPPKVPLVWSNLTVKSLSYRYSPGEPGGLDRVSFALSRGMKIAVVGPSGSGKSTLLKLLAGILEAHEEHIEIDGVRYPLASMSEASLLLPQEPEIFSDTFRYNLTIGEEFSDAELDFAIELGRLPAVLAKLKDGWETNLAEKGLNLSVGEKQRVALARGMLRARQRPFILLDEPTSSLDPVTESQVFSQMLSNFADRTIITVCHRLNIVPLFDQVIYVRDGMITEMGTFSDLIGLQGDFAMAWAGYQKSVQRAEQGAMA